MGIVTILTLSGLGICGILILRELLSRPQSTEGEPREIPLEDLAPIWLKYNREFEADAPQPSAVEEASSPPLGIDTLGDFYSTVIKPYEARFIEQNCHDVLLTILRMLDTHGSHPSVVIDTKDAESTDLITVRDTLAKVSLRDHSLSTARAMLRLVKETYSEPDNFIPQMLIAALAHDIGKIPELRLSGAYGSQDHAIVSANWLAEQFAGKDIFWVRQIVTAVRDHHTKSREPLTHLLREADKETRQMELVSFTAGYRIEPFEKWFSVDGFLSKIEPAINVTARGKWDAFTFRGIVYLRPEFVYETVKDMMFDLNVLDMLMMYESERDTAVKAVVAKLRERGLIPDLLGEGYATRKFEIRMKMQLKKQVQVLIPVRVEPFLPGIDEIERRKAGSALELIEAVTPV
ncbi:MAG: HD domain-containing protein [Candidatus Bathyarchaeia archaeon]